MGINKTFWNNQKQKKLQIQSTLSRKLSNKFRPQPNELYDRGIYVTDPKDNPQHAAWRLANHRRKNSLSLAQRFSQRMKPNEVLQKGIIHMDDYSDLFQALPQTQPSSPTSDDLNGHNMENNVEPQQKQKHTKKRI